MKKLVEGQEIQARVVAVTEECVFLDLNEKSEGVLYRSDLDPDFKVEVGDMMKAFYLGEKNGEMRFTTKIAGEAASSDMLENAWKNEIPVEGFVEQEIKGGYSVKIGSVKAFCPYSQMGFRQKEESAFFVGKNLSFLIQEFKENGRNILVSNRAILEKKYQEHLDGLKTSLTEGMTVSGKIVSVHQYGAFVDIDGFQALLPISEVSRERLQSLDGVLSVGQEINAKIIKADWKNQRVSLSLKSLSADPWDSVMQKYPEGSKHKGTIARVTDYGFFVTLEPGLDGLVHVSELKDENKNTNLRVKFKQGQTFDVAVKKIDLEQKRIGLTPALSNEQDDTTRAYLGNQKDDGDTYNPFAALLKK